MYVCMYVCAHQATHGGRAPPDDTVTAVLKVFLPCFFASDVYIKVGADLENKHRGMYVMTRVVVEVCRVLFEVTGCGNETCSLVAEVVVVR